MTAAQAPDQPQRIASNKRAFAGKNVLDSRPRFGYIILAVSHLFPALAQLESFESKASHLLQSYSDHPATVRNRIERQCSGKVPSPFRLADAELVIAREYGFTSWEALKAALESKPLGERLIDASASGDTATVDALLRMDGSLLETCGGWQQFRPLFFAKLGNHDATATTLRRYGATLNAFEAAALGAVDALTEILRATPEEAKARREHYDATPLHAVRDASVAAAQLLLEHGAHVNAIDSNRQRLTPLHGRAEHGDLPMVQLLLEYGADVHADSCMGTPLHAAVGGFQHEPPATWKDVATCLLTHGADVNAQSQQSETTDWTPLHHAAWRDHGDAVTWLLEQGANPAAMDGKGRLPWQIAEAYGFPQLADLLAKASA